MVRQWVTVCGTHFKQDPLVSPPLQSFVATTQVNTVRKVFSFTTKQSIICVHFCSIPWCQWMCWVYTSFQCGICCYKTIWDQNYPVHLQWWKCRPARMFAIPHGLNRKFCQVCTKLCLSLRCCFICFSLFGSFNFPTNQATFGATSTSLTGADINIC